MFRALALLAFAAISTVCSQDCQLLNNFKHKPALISNLNGPYFGIATSSAKVLDCEKITWSGTPYESTLQARIESSTCCRIVHTPSYTSVGVTFIVTPIHPRPECPQLNQTVEFKMVSSTGTDPNLCLSFTACTSERFGVYEVCQQIVEETVADALVLFLQNLLGALLNWLQGLPAMTYTRVKQQNCTFIEGNCTP